jgi:hypothetical protein
MIRVKGYSTRRFKTLQSGYYNKPTELQQASYNVHLIELVRAGNYDGLSKVLRSGISPNPCNQYGESLVHMVCRRGESQPLQIMLDSGCLIQVADDYGRTPLHDACWAARPAFDVIDKILGVDTRLFHMTDCRGAVPLSYVRKEHWGMWIQYLESRKDTFWPDRDVAQGEEDCPELTKVAPHSCPIRDPPNALTPQLATMVVSGKMSPEEAQMLKYDKDNESATLDESDSEEDYDSDDSDYSDSDYSDSDEDESDDDDFSLDEGEMVDILNSIALPGKAVAW